MSSLLRKDLLILARSRLLVALLIAYPVVIALLIGFAISRSPSRPKVAIVDETPRGQTVEVGSQHVSVHAYAQHLFSQVHLRLAFFHIRPIDLLDVVVIEYGRARGHRRQKRLELLQHPVIEHARIRRSLVHVVFEDVPPREDQIVERGERNELLHFWRASIGALA